MISIDSFDVAADNCCFRRQMIVGFRCRNRLMLATKRCCQPNYSSLFCPNLQPDKIFIFIILHNFTHTYRKTQNEFTKKGGE